MYSSGLMGSEKDKESLTGRQEHFLGELQNQIEMPKTVMLLQFQELSDEYLRSFQKKAESAIRSHLLKYSRVNSDKRMPYNSISKYIAYVCKEASKKLAWNEDDGIVFSHSIPLFQEKWLTNIARLLPENENVLRILPYLITCYIMTAPQNRLDPFNTDPQYAAAGWIDIFRDLRGPDNSTANNLNTSINSICQNFYLPIRKRSEAFFYEESDIDRTEKGRQRGRPSSSNSSLGKETLQRHRVLCWEYYRCFLTLCKICDEVGVNGLNVSLSMALFASIWDWSNIGRYDPALNIWIRQYTESEIETERVVPKDIEDGNKECLEISLRDYILDFTSEKNNPKDFVLYYLRVMHTEKKKRGFDLDKEFDDFGMFFDG